MLLFLLLGAGALAALAASSSDGGSPPVSRDDTTPPDGAAATSADAHPNAAKKRQEQLANSSSSSSGVQQVSNSTDLDSIKPQAYKDGVVNMLVDPDVLSGAHVLTGGGGAYRYAQVAFGLYERGYTAAGNRVRDFLRAHIPDDLFQSYFGPGAAKITPYFLPDSDPANHPTSFGYGSDPKSGFGSGS